MTVTVRCGSCGDAFHAFEDDNPSREVFDYCDECLRGAREGRLQLRGIDEPEQRAA